MTFLNTQKGSTKWNKKKVLIKLQSFGIWCCVDCYITCFFLICKLCVKIVTWYFIMWYLRLHSCEHQGMRCAVGTPSCFSKPFCFNAFWLAAFSCATPLFLMGVSFFIYTHFVRNATRTGCTLLHTRSLLPVLLIYMEIPEIIYTVNFENETFYYKCRITNLIMVTF